MQLHPGFAWGTSFALALAAVLLNLRSLMPAPQPGPTFLSVYDWPEVPTLTPEQVAQYRMDGFIVLRQVIPPEVIDALRTYAAPNLRSEFWDFTSSSIGTVYVPWLKTDLFRDFWWHGPMAKLGSQLLGGAAVRLFTDHLFYLTPQQPGLALHNTADRAFDQHTFVRFWIPLDDVDTHLTGGSLEVVSNRGLAEREPACYDRIRGRAPGMGMSEPECLALAAQQKLAHNFSRGDAIVLAPGVLRASQPLRTDGELESRFAVSVGFSVQDLGTLLQSVPRYKHNALVQMLHPLPECFHIHAREACHPRVWPSRAPRETALRMNGDLYREPPALNKLAAWLSMPFLRRRALQRPSS